MTSPEHFNNDRVPKAAAAALGAIPTDEELMIAKDTAAIVG